MGASDNSGHTPTNGRVPSWPWRGSHLPQVVTSGQCGHGARAAAHVRLCNLVAETAYLGQGDTFVTFMITYKGRTSTMQQPPHKQLPTGNAALSVALALGIAIGTGLGVAMGNIAVGTGVGVAIGVIVGLALRQRTP